MENAALDPAAHSRTSNLSRRGVLRAGAAGLALTAAARGPRSLRAQEASPAASQATPAASPLAAATPVVGTAPARFAYVGSYTRGAPGGGGAAPGVGISVFAVDADSGALTPVQVVPSDNPSFLALGPAQRALYAVNEIDDFEGGGTGSVEAYAIDAATGELALLNRVDAAGAIPAHLAVDPAGDHLVVANYVGATFVVLPISADGRLLPASDVVEQTGSGPNPDRQEAPHPHAVVFDPAGRFVAAADLGTDQVLVFRLDPAAGTLSPVDEAAMAPGAGPRHLAFHPNGRLLYVINELDATITVLPYDPATGALGDPIQTVSTVPADFAGDKSTAEIAVHPSGRFLYGSNRGQEGATAPEADSIAGFAIDPGSGELSLLGYATEGIDFPRNFAIDPTGTWLYVCNQQGDSIVQFRIDPTTGELAATGVVTQTPTPVSLVFAQ